VPDDISGLIKCQLLAALPPDIYLDEHLKRVYDVREAIHTQQFELLYFDKTKYREIILWNINMDDFPDKCLYYTVPYIYDSETFKTLPNRYYLMPESYAVEEDIVNWKLPYYSCCERVGHPIEWSNKCITPYIIHDF
jgi:hypothetical protein